MPGLLEGVRVIDLTHYISGPYCTKLLSGLGADVVKIERLGTGDPVRRLGPFAEPLNTAFGRPSPSERGGRPLRFGACFFFGMSVPVPICPFRDQHIRTEKY